MQPMTVKTLHNVLNAARRLTEVLEMPSFLESDIEDLHDEGLSGLNFDHFDERLLQLVEAGESLKKHFDHHIIRCRRWRNAHLPIHRLLPREIFTRIIKASFTQRTDLERLAQEETDLEILHQLSTVCYSWRQLIDGTPSLWTSIKSCEPQSLVAKALAKSMPAAIDIAFQFHDTYDEFAADIAAHLVRSRSLDLTLESAVDAWSYIPNHAPLLERLEVLSDEDSVPESSIVIDVSEAAMPKLRHLIIENLDVRLEVRLGLLTLNLVNIPGTGPSLTEIIELLRNNPGMEDLRLCSAFPLETRLLRDPLPIYLPHVETLALAGLSELTHARLLSAMQTPEAKHFYTYASYVSSTFLAPSLHRMTQIIKPVAGGSGRVSIRIGDPERPYGFSALRESSPGGVEESLDNSPMMYDITVRLQSSMDSELVKLTVDTLFRDLRDPEVSLDIDCTEGMERWKTWLTTIPHINALRLHGSLTQIAVLQHLIDRGPDGWRCPGLTKLYLHARDYANLHAILDLAYNRCQIDQETAEGGLPKPLEKLAIVLGVTFSETPEEMLEEIKGLVGTERVVVARDPFIAW